MLVLFYIVSSLYVFGGLSLGIFFEGINGRWLIVLAWVLAWPMLLVMEYRHREFSISVPDEPDSRSVSLMRDYLMNGADTSWPNNMTNAWALLEKVRNTSGYGPIELECDAFTWHGSIYERDPYRGPGGIARIKFSHVKLEMVIYAIALYMAVQAKGGR